MSKRDYWHNAQPTNIRISVDTSANKSFVTQQLIEKHNLSLTASPVWMKMADNNVSMSRGTCKLNFSCHGYTATVPMVSMRTDSDFDVIPGCDWLKKNMVDIMFSTSSLHIGCAQSDKRQYDWPVD